MTNASILCGNNPICAYTEPWPSTAHECASDGDYELCSCGPGESATCDGHYPAVTCEGDMCGYPVSCGCEPWPVTNYDCNESEHSCYESSGGSYSSSSACEDSCSSSNPGNPTGPGFRLTVTQPSVTVYQGETATYTVNVEPFNGFLGQVNLSYASCPTNASCSFAVSSVTITDTNTKSTTFNVGTNSVAFLTYTINLTGTYALDANQTSVAAVTLTVQQNPNAICDSQWRDIPSPNNYTSSFAAAQDNSGVYRYSPLPWVAWPYYSGGLMQDKCVFGAGSGVCLWQSSRLGQSDFTGYSVYAQDANNIFLKGGWGYFSGYGLTVTSESTLKYSPPYSWTDMGNISKPWGTPTSVTDKDSRLWNFQYLDYPFYKAQYKCGASPNQAICDGTWRQTSGGGNTPSQPIGTNVNAGQFSNPSPSVGLVIRGTDNQVYYRNCIFSGNECLWNNWSGLGGSTLYSPYTFTGGGWDVVMKNSADNNRWARVNWWNGWDAWSNRGAGDESWGSPYRFTDAKGRTWQYRRNSDTTISYACGAGTNVCILPAFDASKSSVSPTTVNINDNVTIRCDMGVRGMDGIMPAFTGGQFVSYDGYDVTTAKFTFKATQTGTHTVYCNTFVTGQNFCASSNAIGSLTVGAAPAPAINLSPSSLTFNGTSGGTTPAAQNLTIRNSGSVGTTLNWTWTRNPAAGAGTWCKLQTSAGVDIPLNTGGSLASGASVITRVAVNAPSNVGSFTDCGIRIQDANASNNPQNLSLTYAVSNLTAPALAASTSSNCGGKVSLSWNSIIGATGYRVYRGATQVYSGASLSYEDTAPAPSTSYSYTVVAFNAYTTSLSSATASAVSSAACAFIPNIPTDPTGSNGGTVACEKIRFSWKDNSTNETGFKLYRDGVFTGITMPPSSPASQTGSTLTYDYTPGDLSPHTYAISAVTTGGLESAQTSSVGPISAIDCAANLYSSDKDIIGVNSSSYTTSDCSGGNEFPSGVRYKINDIIEFSIKMCNSAPSNGGHSAQTIFITDTLTNLARFDSSKALTDPLAWGYSAADMVYQAPPGVSLSSIQVVSGAEPADLKLKFTLNGSIPAGNSSAKLRLKAKTAVPASYAGNSSRFRNNASITYIDDGASHTATVSLSTPLLLFTRSNAPDIIEVAP